MLNSSRSCWFIVGIVFATIIAVIACYGSESVESTITALRYA